jgi:predicted signal transduction protein with EAL and GGDEF domain
VAHPDTITTIAAALLKAGLDPRRLLVEVTESAVVEDAEAAQQALAHLSALGVRIAIDDFGTGYSSLLYLKRYPIQALKVDRNFVSGMGVSDDDDAIVASVVSLARAVGAVCIAEGVETEAQHRALLTLGCHYAQGYLFGRPAPAAEVPALVKECDRRLQLPVPYESAARARRQLKVSAEIVRRIEQLHGDGASLHTIAAALNKEHVPTDHGGRWVSATVARVIASGRITG